MKRSTLLDMRAALTAALAVGAGTSVRESAPARKLKVLLVGQTPPPLHGQSIMIERLCGANWPDVELTHVRMRFSDEIGEVSKLRAKKLVRLVELIAQTARARLSAGSEVLCYPPAGPNRVAMYRDIVFLLSCRWMFARTVFHFHAGGLSELRAELRTWERWLFDRAYRNADCAILLSERNPPDGARLAARRTVVVPYGIPDVAAQFPRRRANGGRPRILYVGALRETKGVLVLLEAAAQLKSQQLDFEIELVGAWHSPEFREQCEAFIAAQSLAQRITWRGVLDGAAKWQTFADADVFCFPTYFEAETFGVVLLEAMSFGLPIVASDWRGTGSVVVSELTGLLTPPRDPSALATALHVLLVDPARREAYGRSGRRRYELQYTLDHWLSNMHTALLAESQ
jgi:glycosyltransferase involved in cell wall biosynthesis